MQNKGVSISIFISIIIIVVIVIVIQLLKDTPIKENKIIKSAIPNPTHAPAVPFTGVIDEPVNKDAQEYSRQNNDLLDKVPIKVGGFSVDFDFEKDIYRVSVDEPRESNIALFEDWLKSTYPALGRDRFEIK